MGLKNFEAIIILIIMTLTENTLTNLHQYESYGAIYL